MYSSGYYAKQVWHAHARLAKNKHVLSKYQSQCAKQPN